MIPHLELPAFELGGITFTAFRLLAVAAVAVQFELTVRRAPRFGIDRGLATSLVGWAVVLGLLSAHILDVLMYYPERLRADPMELFRSWGSLSSTGGMLGGITGLVIVARWKKVGRDTLVQFLDVLLFALPFTLGVGRLGCALQHDHLGVHSDHFLAVAFPTGPRFDLGLLEFGWLAILCGAFLFLDRRPRPRVSGSRRSSSATPRSDSGWTFCAPEKPDTLDGPLRSFWRSARCSRPRSGCGVTGAR